MQATPAGGFSFCFVRFVRKSDEGYVQGLLNFDENILGLKKKKDEPKGNVKK